MHMNCSFQMKKNLKVQFKSIVFDAKLHFVNNPN